MFVSSCIKASRQPVEWTPLRLNPPINYHCTFYDLPDCKRGAKTVLWEGGFESSNLRLFPNAGYWYQNIRSFKCKYGHSYPVDARSDDLEKPDMVEKRRTGETPNPLDTTEKHQIERHFNKVPIPAKYKAEAEVEGDTNSPNADHLMTIWTEPIYAGTFSWVMYAQMLSNECVNLDGHGWASLQLHPMDTVYNCVLFKTPMCTNPEKAVKLEHGEQGFDIAHFGLFLDGSWWHNIISIRCRPCL
ncbi:hypothetical protein PMIN04_003987 [Paraphaeosphaeria minitans]